MTILLSILLVDCVVMRDLRSQRAPELRYTPRKSSMKHQDNTYLPQLRPTLSVPPCSSTRRALLLLGRRSKRPRPAVTALTERRGARTHVASLDQGCRPRSGAPEDAAPACLGRGTARTPCTRVRSAARAGAWRAVALPRASNPLARRRRWPRRRRSPRLFRAQMYVA